MFATDRIDGQRIRSLAQFSGRHTKHLRNGSIIEQPFELDRKITGRHQTLNAGRITEIRRLSTEVKWSDFRCD